MGINEPRKIDYDFKLILYDGWAFLFDDSSRTYCASTRPCVYLVPVFKEGCSVWDTEELYDQEPAQCYTDPVYLGAEDLHLFPAVDLLKVDKAEEEEIAWEEAQQELWDGGGFYSFPEPCI